VGPPGVITAFKTTDEARQYSAGESSDSHLTLDFEPLTTYVIDGCIWFETTIDNAGFIYELDWDGSTYNASLSVIVRDFDYDKTRVWENYVSVNVSKAILDYTGDTGTIIGCVYIQGTFTAITDGTLSFSWGQVDSREDYTTVFAGSYLRAIEV
jgi:hypothetical protein